jgi:mannose-6-phosphate isomerase-like protein (cupin superfamily)
MSDTKPIQAPKGVQQVTEPTLVRYSEATRFLWGDEEAHQVYDWIYGRLNRLGALIFSLRPGDYFKSSKTWKPLYNQDRFYYVLQGELAIHDPESGEVAVAAEGEAIYWRGNKWHFGYNFGQRETLVLDWAAPSERAANVPEIEASLKKPDLPQIVGGQYELLGKWPMEHHQSREVAWREGGMITIGRKDCLHLIWGDEKPTLVSLFISTPVITGGVIDLRPGHMAESEAHPGDEVLFATRGRLNVYLPESYDWFELHPKDCLLLPEGVKHQYANFSDEPAQLVFAVAPAYR